jgi:hypothetical protein
LILNDGILLRLRNGIRQRFEARAMIEQLRANGCVVDDRIEETEQGVFGWVMDPEGNRVELWQAPKGQ